MQDRQFWSCSLNIHMFLRLSSWVSFISLDSSRTSFHANIYLIILNKKLDQWGVAMGQTLHKYVISAFSSFSHEKIGDLYKGTVFHLSQLMLRRKLLSHTMLYCSFHHRFKCLDLHILWEDVWNLYQNKNGLFSSEIYFITLRSLCKGICIRRYPHNVNCNIMMICWRKAFPPTGLLKFFTDHY